MIPRIVSRKIAMYNFPCVLFSIVSARHRNHFSDASLEKDKNYKKIIEDQISIDQRIGVNLIEEEYFRNHGWTISKEETIIELFKQIDRYEVRLMSKIKSLTTKRKEEKPDTEDKIEDKKQEIMNNLNQVIVYVSKRSSGKTMTVNAFVSDRFQISSITFAESLAEAKFNRLDIFTSNRYTGPSVESYTQDLFTGIHAFLKIKLGVQNEELLKTLVAYSKKSERVLYVEWLKNFSQFL